MRRLVAPVLADKRALRTAGEPALRTAVEPALRTAGRQAPRTAHEPALRTADERATREAAKPALRASCARRLVRRSAVSRGSSASTRNALATMGQPAFRSQRRAPTTIPRSPFVAATI